MLVYHGSNCIVKEPQIILGSRLLDFGAGFYTTTNKEQAERWAAKVAVRREPREQIVSIYEVDENHKNSLKIISFDKPNAEWLHFVCDCRSGKNFGLEYDMVFGPVANDKVYSVVSFFERGVYDEADALKRLQVEPLFNQVLFHTDKALDFCKYIDYYKV